MDKLLRFEVELEKESRKDGLLWEAPEIREAWRRFVSEAYEGTSMSSLAHGIYNLCDRAEVMLRRQRESVAQTAANWELTGEVVWGKSQGSPGGWWPAEVCVEKGKTAKVSGTQTTRVVQFFNVYLNPIRRLDADKIASFFRAPDGSPPNSSPDGRECKTAMKLALEVATARQKEMEALHINAGKVPSRLKEVVWAKLAGYPWWPAEKCEDDGSKGVAKDNQCLVYFFGESSYGFPSETNARPFVEQPWTTPDGKGLNKACKAAMAAARKRLKELGISIPEPDKSQPKSAPLGGNDNSKKRGRSSKSSKEETEPSSKKRKKKVPASKSTDHVKAGALHGTLVWAHLNGFPWWPAEICDCLDPSEPTGVREVEEGTKFVFFYGSNDIGFVSKWAPLDEAHLEVPSGGKKQSRESIAALALAKNRLTQIRDIEKENPEIFNSINMKQTRGADQGTSYKEMDDERTESETETEAEALVSSEAEIEDEFSCPNCGKEFTSHAAMSGHKRYCIPASKKMSVMPKPAPQPKAVSKPSAGPGKERYVKKGTAGITDFPCPNCKRAFSSHAAMSGHKRYCKVVE